MGRRLLAMLGTLAFAGSLAQDVRTAPTAAQSPGTIAALQARARNRGGPVRVIVQQTGAFVPEDRQPNAAAAAGQRDRIREATRQLVARGGAGLGHVKEFSTLPYFAADADANAIAALTSSPLVASIVEDVPRPIALNQSGPLIGAPQAWSAGYTGAGWAVAILDSGVDGSHEFLLGKVTAEACHSTTDRSGATTSQSLCPGGSASASFQGAGMPCTGSIDCMHGTHVAGIAAGRGSSFSGIGRDAKIISIQVFSRFSAQDCGGMSSCLFAWDSDVIAALDQVYTLRSSLNIAAVNLSLGSEIYSSSCDSTSPAMTAAVDQLKGVGIATIAAAGNGGSASGLAFPACITNVISVGSTTKSDVLSSFSNGGTRLSLVAPGESILSSIPGESYAVMSGTSMAAPHVSGAWAVLKQHKPSASVDELLDALRSTGSAITDTRAGGSPTYRRIRVDAALGVSNVPEPYMALDTPQNGETAEPVFLSGWALDRGSVSGAGVDAVHVWAYPSTGAPPVFVGIASLGGQRDDVGAAFGTRFSTSGYCLTVSGLAAGTYQLVASAHSTVSGTFNDARAVTVTLSAPSPAMSVDTPVNPASVSGPFAVAGWAIDRASSTSPGVDAIHVWAFPTSGEPAIFAGEASLGGARADVGAVMGSPYTNSGYYLTANLPPGTYDVAVYAHSSVSLQFNQYRVVRVVVR